MEQLLAAFETGNAYFWATHGGAEIDLLITRGGKRYGFECQGRLAALARPGEGYDRVNGERFPYACGRRGTRDSHAP